MYMMKILIDIGHPAHVHLFKNLIWSLKKKGHDVHITARDKEIVLKLLNYYKFEYTLISKSRKGLLHIGKEMIQRDYNLFNLVRKIHPDIMIAVLDPSITHIGKLLKIPTITLTDTEHAAIANALTFPFSDIICTPSCYKDKIGKKQIQYNSYHEISYLHPNYFKPNPKVLDELGLSTGDIFFVIRLSSFEASHDIHTLKIRSEYIGRIIEKLEEHGRILVFSEPGQDSQLKKFECTISPEKYHDILYYSHLYIGEGSTSAEEAAILGTPSLHFERLSINGKIQGVAPFIGILEELQNKYQLLFSFYEEEQLLNKLDELLIDIVHAKSEWYTKKEVLLKDKIDLTAFLVWFIENFPSSVDTIKRDPRCLDHPGGGF
jgi:predicted glycosyltransferase